MRILFHLTVSILFIIPVSANAEWVKTNGPCSASIISIAAGSSEMYVGTSGGGIYRSADGVNFSYVNSNMWSTTITAIYITNYGVLAGTGGSGIFITTNQGAGWIEKNNGITNPNINSFAELGSYIFAAAPNGVYRSGDQTNTWTAMNTGLSNTNAGRFFVSNGKLYVTTQGGVFVSENSGESWLSITSALTNKNVKAIIINGSRILVSNSSGIFYSDNNGTSWTASVTSIGKTVNAFEIIGTTLFAATAGAGCYKSVDNGATWSACNSFEGIFNLNGNVLIKRGSNLYYGSGGGGLYVSSNEGSSWNANNSGLASSSVNGVYSVNGVVYAGVYGGGIHISTNQGQTWVPANNGISSTSFTTFTSVGTTVFAGAFDNGGIYYTTNNGVSWTQCLANKSIFVLATAAAPGGTKIFAAAGDGLYYSSNNGASWTKHNSIPSNVIQALAFHGAVGAATRYNFSYAYITTDYGDTWVQSAGAVPNSGLKSVEVFGTDILVGTYNGLYLTSDFGSTWVEKNTGLPQYLTVNEIVKISRTGANYSSWTRKPPSADFYAMLLTQGDKPFLFGLAQGASVASDNGVPDYAGIMYCGAAEGDNLYGGGFAGGIFITSVVTTIDDAFPILEPAILLEPKFTDIKVNRKPQFKWKNSKNAVTVDLEIYEEAAEPLLKFKYRLPAVSDQEQTYTIPDELSYNTMYIWRIITQFTNLAELASSDSPFMTGCGPCVRISPANNAENVSTKTAFTWENAEDAQTVTLTIIDHTAVAPIKNYTMEVTGDVQSFTPNEPLPLNTQIEWKVTNDCYEESSFSEMWLFRTVPPHTPAELKYPYNNMSDVSIPAGFQWKNASNATHVDLVIYDSTGNELFKYRLEVEAGEATHFDMPDSLDYLTHYKWKVISHSGYDEEATDYFYFRTECLPCKMLTPPDGDNRVPRRTTFSWRNSSGVVHIYLFVDYEIPSGDSVIYKHLSYDITAQGEIQSFTIPETDELPPYTEIEWSIVSDCSGPYTHNEKYTYITEARDCYLEYPADGAERVSVKTVFGWTDADDAVSVEIVVMDKFGAEIHRATLPAKPGKTQSFFLPDSLDYYQYYSWKITTYTEFGEEETPAARFRTECYPCIPVSPKDSSKNVSVNPTLRWYNTGESKKLKVILMYDVTKDSFIVYRYELDAVGEYQSYTIPDKLPNNTKFDWWVQNDCQDEWNVEMFSFTTISNKCILIYPPDGDTYQIASGTIFQWNNAADAEKVLLSIFDSTGVEVLHYELDAKPGALQTFEIPDKLKYSTKYQWVVYTKTASGYEASETFVFTTGCKPNELVSPANNADKVSVKPTFTWMNSEGAKLADLYIYYKESFSDTTFDVELHYALDVSGKTQSYTIPVFLPSDTKVTWLVINDCEGDYDQAVFYFTTGNTTDVKDPHIIPEDYILEQNHPNPFNPVTIIRFGVPEESRVKIDVFNMLGEHIRECDNSVKQPGYYDLIFNGQNLSSGIYIYTMRAKSVSSNKEFYHTKKFVLIK